MQVREESLNEDVSSPTASVPFIFMIAAIAAEERREVRTVDIPVAYLNADNSKHNITITLDPTVTKALVRLKPEYAEYVRPNGTLVCKLNRALYGCIESARLWYELLRSVLESDGYTANPIDPCVMNKWVDGVQCTVVIYVDDLLFTCVHAYVIDATLEVLRKTFKSELTVHTGLVHDYLGIHFDFAVQGKVCRSTYETSSPQRG
jgi:hypothetical protein